MANHSLKIIFSVVLMDLVGFGLILPIVPIYAETLGGSPLYIGALLSVYSAMQFLLNPIWGKLSDRVGRRPVILFSLAGSVISYLVYGMAERVALPGGWVLAVLFASRLFAGVMGANIATAQAYVADVTTPKERARGMGMVGAAIGMGFVLGPAMGALFTQDSIRETYGMGLAGFAAAAICAINWVWAFMALPESLSAENKARARHEAGGNRLALMRSRPTLALLVTCALLITLAFSQFEATFSLVSRKIMGLSPAQIGLIFSYLGVIVVLMQAAVTRLLVRELGEETVLLLGAIVMGLGLAGIAQIADMPVVLVPLALLGVGFGAVQPALLALVSQYSAPHQQGMVLGIGQSMSSLGRILGPLFALQLFGAVSPLSPFWLASLFMAMVTLIALMVTISSREKA